MHRILVMINWGFIQKPANLNRRGVGVAMMGTPWSFDMILLSTKLHGGFFFTMILIEDTYPDVAIEKELRMQYGTLLYMVEMVNQPRTSVSYLIYLL